MKSLKDGEFYLVRIKPGRNESNNLEGLKKYFTVSEFPPTFKARYKGSVFSDRSEGFFECFKGELGPHYRTIREGLIEVVETKFYDKEEDML